MITFIIKAPKTINYIIQGLNKILNAVEKCQFVNEKHLLKTTFNMTDSCIIIKATYSLVQCNPIIIR